jgi:saccharopine dehydrogenase-like NADP-dependent oxidoreductase
MLSHLLQRRLAPVEGDRDMVILVHEMEVETGGAANELVRQTSTMVDIGEAREMSAMARTVGLPAALALEMILAGELKLTGCQLPTEPAVFDPILVRLRAEGLGFTERTEVIAHD